MKLCKDCKHINNPFRSYPKCIRPIGISAVSGNIDVRDIYCDNERLHDWFTARLIGACGKEGRYFERSNDDI